MKFSNLISAILQWENEIERRNHSVCIYLYKGASVLSVILDKFHLYLFVLYMPQLNCMQCTDTFTHRLKTKNWLWFKTKIKNNFFIIFFLCYHILFSIECSMIIFLSIFILYNNIIVVILKSHITYRFRFWCSFIFYLLFSLVFFKQKIFVSHIYFFIFRFVTLICLNKL